MKTGEATGNLCVGSKAAVQERVGSFLTRLARRKDEVRRPLPDRSAIESRRTGASLPERFRPHPNCTSHLGFSLVQSHPQLCIIIHELAHSFTDAKMSHGPQWGESCAKVGAILLSQALDPDNSRKDAPFYFDS